MAWTIIYTFIIAECMVVSLRRFKESDEQWIRKEWRTSQEELFATQEPWVSEMTHEYTEEVLADDLLQMSDKWKPPNVFFVAEDERNNLLGTIGIKVAGSKPETGEICRFFVLRSKRCQGIGRKLVNHAITWAKKTSIKVLTLETTGYQVAAVNLYLSHGFELSRTRS